MLRFSAEKRNTHNSAAIRTNFGPVFWPLLGRLLGMTEIRTLIGRKPENQEPTTLLSVCSGFRPKNGIHITRPKFVRISGPFFGRYSAGYRHPVFGVFSPPNSPRNLPEFWLADPTMHQNLPFSKIRRGSSLVRQARVCQEGVPAVVNSVANRSIRFGQEDWACLECPSRRTPARKAAVAAATRSPRASDG